MGTKNQIVFEMLGAAEARGFAPQRFRLVGLTISQENAHTLASVTAFIATPQDID